MLVSPFTFDRGAALLMASDLAATPQSGLWVQACGDAHLSNFGAFGSRSGSWCSTSMTSTRPIPGRWEWDVKRLVTSLEVAGRSNGFTDVERRAVLLAGVRGLRTTMARFAAMSNLDVWYASLDITDHVERLQEDRRREGGQEG